MKNILKVTDKCCLTCKNRKFVEGVRFNSKCKLINEYVANECICDNWEKKEGTIALDCKNHVAAILYEHDRLVSILTEDDLKELTPEKRGKVISFSFCPECGKELDTDQIMCQVKEDEMVNNVETILNNEETIEKCCGTCISRRDEAQYGTNPCCPSIGHEHICDLTGESVAMHHTCENWFYESLLDECEPSDKEKILDFLNSEEGQEAILKVISEGVPFSDKIKEARNIDSDEVRRPIMKESAGYANGSLL